MTDNTTESKPARKKQIHKPQPPVQIGIEIGADCGAHKRGTIIKVAGGPATNKMSKALAFVRANLAMLVRVADEQGISIDGSNRVVLYRGLRGVALTAPGVVADGTISLFSDAPCELDESDDDSDDSDDSDDDGDEEAYATTSVLDDAEGDDE